jgi:hypothetical protein
MPKLPYGKPRTTAQIKAEALAADPAEQPEKTQYIFIENGVEIGYADCYPVVLPELEPNVLVQETGEPPSPFPPPPPGYPDPS